MLNYHLNQWLWCSYKGIHFTIINHIHIYAWKTKKSNNQSKQRPSPLNKPSFKTILLSIYRILNSALFIMNVSVEPNLPKKQHNKLALTSLSSLILFSVSFFHSVWSLWSLKNVSTFLRCQPTATSQSPQEVNKTHSLHWCYGRAHSVGDGYFEIPLFNSHCEL